MKVCNSCKNSKLLSEFGNNKSSTDGKQGYCKSCSSEKDRRHYQTSQSRKLNIRSDQAARVDRARQFIWEYFSSHSCVDCGNTNPVVLEFDHLSDKIKNVSTMISHGNSIDLLQSEIAKCEVRCANCHKIKTARQFGWWRLLDKHKG